MLHFPELQAVDNRQCVLSHFPQFRLSVSFTCVTAESCHKPQIQFIYLTVEESWAFFFTSILPNSHYLRPFYIYSPDWSFFISLISFHYSVLFSLVFYCLLCSALRICISALKSCPEQTAVSNKDKCLHSLQLMTLKYALEASLLQNLFRSLILFCLKHKKTTSCNYGLLQTES